MIDGDFMVMNGNLTDKNGDMNGNDPLALCFIAMLVMLYIVQLIPWFTVKAFFHSKPRQITRNQCW